MFKKRMLRAKQRIHLIRVRKRPTMLESDISKLYPVQRRTCKFNILLSPASVNSIRVGVFYRLPLDFFWLSQSWHLKMF